jgi:hypothetical protein
MGELKGMKELFAGRHFDREIIVLCVRWYLALMDPRRMSLRVGLMTREYPPNVYGGAGVHVEYLSRELAKRIDVEVHRWGDQFLDEEICMSVALSRGLRSPKVLRRNTRRRSRHSVSILRR